MLQQKNYVANLQTLSSFQNITVYVEALKLMTT